MEASLLAGLKLRALRGKGAKRCGLRVGGGGGEEGWGRRVFSLPEAGATWREPFTYNLLSLLSLPHFNPVLLV